MWFLNGRFPGSAPLGMSALLPPLPHSWVSSWPRGALEFFVLPGHLGCVGQQSQQVCGNVHSPLNSELLRFLAKISWFVLVGPKLLLPLSPDRCVKIPKQQPKASPSTRIMDVEGERLKEAQV